MSDNDFDRDDELRALLRSGDPVGSLSPADPAALANLLEDIMSADLEIRPDAEKAPVHRHPRPQPAHLAGRRGGRRRDRRRRAFAITGLSGYGQHPAAGRTRAARHRCPDVAGVTTELGVPPAGQVRGSGPPSSWLSTTWPSRAP